MSDTNFTKTNYVPTPKESARRTEIYSYIETMRELKDKAMPHFQTGPYGERSFNAYLDDSERILNGYTLSRDDQGKESWQSNLMDNITRAKLKAIAAGVGLKVPEMAFDASNSEGVRSAIRAEIIKNIAKQSYSDTNPTLNAFLEVWHILSHGVVFEYEGYKTGGAMQEVIESFNSLTGEVKTKKEYRKMDGKPFALILNPQEFYWWTFFVRDIQEQPRLAWVQHYTGKELELEFSKYPKYKFVKDKAEIGKFQFLQNQLYFDKWSSRVGNEDDYEVIRYYSKSEDRYEIWVNGVPLLQTPLLWGDKEKVYPFAKQTGEPFANTNFFVGMSLPCILEAYQDGKNTVLNTLIDKLYRSVDPLKLVGLQNRDLLDVESSITSQDNTIYVPDINAVKFMEHPNINQGELAMLNILDRGIELESVDRSQQGVGGGTQKTARQAVIEDARAREIKGILFIALEDLWFQKTKLRTQIVLTHYLKDKASQENVRDRIITVKDYSFGDNTRGVLDIYVAKNKRDRLSKMEIEAREQAAMKQGIAYKLISMDVDYLDDWKYDFKIIPQSFHKENQQEKEDELMSEIQQITTLFPEFFVANKEKYLKEILEVHGKHIDEFNPPAQVPPSAPVNKVSESISFKDLPPEGKIQMAKQAGIDLNPVNPLDIGAGAIEAQTGPLAEGNNNLK